jgi:D-alanine-D-alanine ligase
VNLCLFLGGSSAEREVSLMSGAGMARALEARGHNVTLLDPATNRAMKLADFHADPPKADAPSVEAIGQFGAGVNLIESLLSDTVRNADAVVLGLHGVPGEDGLVQFILESLGKPYTGSTSRVSAVCIDKALTKLLLEQQGVPVPKGIAIPHGKTHNELSALFDKCVKEYKLPLVIKPNDQGSTVGLTILKENDPAQFIKAVELSWLYSQKSMV